MKLALALPESFIPTNVYEFGGFKRLTLSIAKDDYEKYASLPAALNYDGGVYVRQGWDSDSGVVYYKEGKAAVKINNI